MRRRPWQVPHQDRLLRRRLDRRSLALFAPGEDVVIAVDGVTKLPGVRDLLNVFLWVNLGQLAGRLSEGHRALYGPVSPRVQSGIIAVTLLVRFGLRLAGSRRITVALTTVGVVECGTDWLGRPRSVLRRAALEDDWFFEGGRSRVLVVAGAVEVHTDRARADALWDTMESQRARRLEARLWPATA